MGVSKTITCDRCKQEIVDKLDTGFPDYFVVFITANESDKGVKYYLCIQCSVIVAMHCNDASPDVSARALEGQRSQIAKVARRIEQCLRMGTFDRGEIARWRDKLNEMSL